MRSVRIIAVFLLLIMTLSLPVYSTEGEGLTFAADTLYKVSKAYEVAPATVEAWINLPAEITGRAGIIAGNYKSESDKPYAFFGINENGTPRFHITADNTYGNYVFTDVHVNTGEWLHLAIVRDADAKKVYCYVNGELKGTLNDTFSGDPVITRDFAIGSDLRDGNSQYFKGAIRSVAIYSNARTAEEIAADKREYGTNGLIALYDLTKTSVGLIADQSGNGYDIKFRSVWIDPQNQPSPTDYAYSFAVVGDTQNITDRYKDKLGLVYDWILDNAEEKNTKFVFGLGDITENSNDEEWTLAMEAIKQMDGRLPYSLVRGNHDYPSYYKKYVSYNDYKDVIAGSYDNTMLNTYQELIISEDIRYLIFSLDFGPSDKVLAWAGDVIADHPYHNVIITTHAYLFKDGTTLDDDDHLPPSKNGGYNDGDDMWDKLVSVYDNIVLVMSGHIIADRIVMTQTKAYNGNTVTQMLIDPEEDDINYGGVGAVAMLYFSEDGRNVTVEYYSTLKEKYFMSENQFTMTLDAVKYKEDESKSDQTEKPTEAPTEKPTAAPDDTSKPTDTDLSVIEAPIQSKGCGSTVPVAAVGGVTVLAACGCFLKRRRRK